jgi:hypothetical protein
MPLLTGKIQVVPVVNPITFEGAAIVEQLDGYQEHRNQVCHRIQCECETRTDELNMVPYGTRDSYYQPSPTPSSALFENRCQKRRSRLAKTPLFSGNSAA